MKIKTIGKCTQCRETYTSAKAKSHLIECIASSLTFSQLTTGGFLIRISGAEQLKLYWMFIALSKDASLGQLDRFLRDNWLECCGHLSEFTIGGHRYMSHTESGRPSQTMKNTIGQLLHPGLKFGYVYDM